MKLEIVSPQKIIFSGNVDSVTLPGVMGSFSVLENHAPLIASLSKGVITYKIKENGIRDFSIDSGLCEVSNNKIYVCVEHINNTK
jgi:F-type H+-transporting ATPase subunit epsilon